MYPASGLLKRESCCSNLREPALLVIAPVHFDLVGNVKAQFEELYAQSLPRDPQQTSSLVLTAVGVFQNAGQ